MSDQETPEAYDVDPAALYDYSRGTGRTEDPEAEASERPAHESEDQGAIQTLQEWRDGSIVRFEAFCIGLGSRNAQGRFRVSRDVEWIAAHVDDVVQARYVESPGPIYCVHRLTAP